MADTKVQSNGNITVWAVPTASIADYNAPTADEINNSGLNISPAIAWDSTTIPHATASDDVDDRAITDKGNASTRGAASFEATLKLFYPKPISDTESDYGKAFQFFKSGRISVYLITRVLQADPSTPAAAGQWISVFKMVSDGWQDDLDGDDSYKYSVSFLPQGDVSVYTLVADPDATIAVTAPSASSGAVVVNTPTALRATYGSKDITNVVTWSSDAEGLSVTENGVATLTSGNGGNITASHPALGDGTLAITAAS